jgi:hypothetical protein
LMCTLVLVPGSGSWSLVPGGCLFRHLVAILINQLYIGIGESYRSES